MKRIKILLTLGAFVSVMLSGDMALAQASCAFKGIPLENMQ